MNSRSATVLCWAVLAATAGQRLEAGNAVVIHNTSAEEQKQRPVTVSRWFAEGEIERFPQARLAGKPTLTQANVMTRWPDKSVKHALVSFLVNLPANGSADVDFASQPQGNDTDGLGREDMLDARFGFDAAIEITAGTKQAVSARRMLEDRQFRYWLKGPIVTQVILEDRSSALRYDMGVKDVGRTLVTTYAAPVDKTSLTVRDASDIEPGDVIRIDHSGEQVYIAGKKDNELVVGTPEACPSVQGRGWKGTKASAEFVRHPSVTVLGKEGRLRAETEPKFKSLHPIFVATFCPSQPGSVRVEMILENIWLDRLQDQRYALSLKVGRPLAEVYAKPEFNHIANTRWRKVFWCGRAPADVYVDYNFAYLAQSGAVSNFDQTKSPSSAAFDNFLKTSLPNSEDPNNGNPGWLRSDKGEIGGRGQIYKTWHAPGGRADIGLFTTWQVMYLYSMKSAEGLAVKRLIHEALVGNGEAGNHIPMFYREPRTDRPFHTGSREDAFGRFVSIDTHPGIITKRDLWYSDDSGGDAVWQHNVATNDGWAVELQHQPNLFYLPYLITGDWYFLESLQGNAAHNLAWHGPGKNYLGRGGSWGYMHAEFRGHAWGLRAVGEAAAMSLDGTPEQAYFIEKLNNNIAVREGYNDIRTGSFYEAATTEPYNEAREQSRWAWGRNTFAHGKPNPLRFHVHPQANWMMGYAHVTWNHIEELGFRQIRPYRTEMLKNLLGQILHPDYNPYLTEAYYTQACDANGDFFRTWKEVRAALADPNRSKFTSTWAEHGYAVIARAIASMLPGIKDGEFDGQRAWEWMRDNVPVDARDFNDNPKWAFVPRAPKTGSPPPPEKPPPRKP